MNEFLFKQEASYQMTALHAPESSWTPPSLVDLPDWGSARVAVDIESKDETIRKLGPGARRESSFICGVAFAIEDGPSFYLPTRHYQGGNLDEKQVFRYLRDQAKKFTGVIVGANLSYDIDYLAEYDVLFKSAQWFRDVQIAEPLLDENQFQYNLDAIAERYGIPGKDERLLRSAANAFNLDPKAELWKLHSKYVGGYAEQDVRLPHQLIRKQEKKLEEQDLWNVYNLESKLLLAIVKMTRRGVLIDTDQLERVTEMSIREEEKAIKNLSDLSGIKYGMGDTNSAKALSRAFDKLGITYPLTAKAKLPSMKADFLKTVDHPIAECILRAKKFNKVRNTFVNSIERHMVGDRLYPGYAQLRTQDDDTGDTSGARFGRLSSSHPNIQQQPSPDKDPEIGKMWRMIYLPDPGALWGCNDYSQQEPRWTVHFAEGKSYVGSKFAGDKYRNDPTTDSHQMMADMIKGGPASKAERKIAKAIFLGLGYGMGEASLCKSLGLPTVWVPAHWDETIMVERAGPEGKKLMKQFGEAVPYIGALTARAKEKVEEVGYIRTYAGRRCRFPRNENGKREYTYRAMNRLIQGSAADQTKMAMVAADEANFKIQIQVHDELDWSTEGPKESQALAEVMMNCSPMRVPSKIDMEMGRSWGQIA